MKAIEGGMSITMASSIFSVPRKTLDDCIKGKVVHGTNSSPCTALDFQLCPLDLQFRSCILVVQFLLYLLVDSCTQRRKRADRKF